MFLQEGVVHYAINNQTVSTQQQLNDGDWHSVQINHNHTTSNLTPTNVTSTSKLILSLPASTSELFLFTFV